MALLTLPYELVERILLLLATESVQTCRLVNRALSAIIQSSALLQYSQACEAAGVIDNPRSLLSYPERLEALEKREDAWRKLKPVFETTIKVEHQQSSLYGLTEGMYFLGDNNEKDLHYCHLPLSPQDDPRWFRIPRHGTEEGLPARLVNFATAVYEHDLIIKAISSQIGNPEDMQEYSLDLVLLQFSTGEYHPLARHPRIHVQTSPDARLWVYPGIAGDNLVLVVNGDYVHNSKLLIFDWKTGHKRLEHDPMDYDSYFDFAFISPELLLVPNYGSGFEVWHLSPNSKPPVNILCLQIPAISDEYRLRKFHCHGEPNSFLHPKPCLPPRPFFPSPESSIININIHIWTIAFDASTSFTLIMHRRALLETIQKWTSSCLPEQREDVETSSTNRFAAHEIQWKDWGPPISRFFHVHESQVRWNVNSIGQRYTFAYPNPSQHGRRTLIVYVVDFNPHNIWKHAEMMTRLRGEGEDNGGNVNEVGQKETEEGMEILDDKGVFSEEVYMGLKCVVYRAPDEYDFDAVLMDGERLLGLKLDHENRHKSVQVLYFG
ncbi:hypothetical protein M378DRAFT_164939 [Amanita muscaria Koide BX008]|uniref:F-box domain-containing protein n=1 Tax=Amanita muscaria (strain Koide BX008) TaxID=946122 RepID=A0A0C2X2X8_AMAMK|nr:hypothetical protein M378DRAFT_164939 [Amanita muscaria Koide BX008]